MCVAGGQALVEKMMLEVGVRGLQSSGEGLGLGGLGAGGAVGVERVADDDGGDVVLANEPRNHFQVGTQSSAVKGEERLGCKTQRIRDSHADAAITDIEREGAGYGHGGSVRLESAEKGRDKRMVWR